MGVQACACRMEGKRWHWGTWCRPWPGYTPSPDSTIVNVFLCSPVVQISDAERWEVVTFVVSAVKGYCEWDGRGDPIFPGSQPVSLDRQNIQQLTNIR